MHCPAASYEAELSRVRSDQPPPEALMKGVKNKIYLHGRMSTVGLWSGDDTRGLDDWPDLTEAERS